MAKVMFCPNCGHEGKTKMVTPGSFLIELVLWIAFIIPGLIYSIWRHTVRHDACAECGHKEVINPNSPMARKLKQHNN